MREGSERFDAGVSTDRGGVVARGGVEGTLAVRGENTGSGCII